MTRIALLIAICGIPDFALAQDAAGQHGTMQHMANMSHEAGEMNESSVSDGVTEGGQSAFAAIQEAVARILADPQTDWTRVDIEALRQHLIDMDNVTLRARVKTREVADGYRFEATSEGPAVTASIRHMVPAHVATVNGVEGWTMQAEEIPGGAALTVTSGDPARIRALGFIGVMTVGMHHQTHHLALALGQNPHAHSEQKVR